MHSTSSLDSAKGLAGNSGGTQGATHMAGYKLATYQTSDGARAGLVIDDKVYDAAKLTGEPDYASVLGILADWRTARGLLKKAAAAAGKSRVKPLPLARTKLLAPVRWPSAIYCAGANYADHAAEMARRMNRPMEPDPHTQGLKAWHFIKASRALADPGATVKISGVSDQVDWEVELVAVIGRAAKNVPEDKALDYVAGYTAANDLSARDLGRRANISDTSPFKADWTKHKTFDGSCPLGPWIVPASDIGDPQNLGLKLWVNDVLKQDSNSKDMIFNLAEQIARLSSGNDASSRRPRPDGNAGRGRVGARRVPQTRRCGQDLDRKDRDAEQQDGLNARFRSFGGRQSGMPSGMPDQRCCRWLHSNICIIQMTIEAAFSARIAPGRPPQTAAQETSRQ
jgi:2-keto-4-pentenoate hydratase/2-oxohepta-3-ene-1,7-dioic acid hydratase in catechol pathway